MPLRALRESEEGEICTIQVGTRRGEGCGENQLREVGVAIL